MESFSVALTRQGWAGYDYKVYDASGEPYCSGWARGNRQDAKAIAREHALATLRMRQEDEQWRRDNSARKGLHNASCART